MKIPKEVLAYVGLIVIDLICLVILADAVLTPSQIEMISKLTAAFATILVGIVAGYIAWRQAKTAENQRDIAREKLRLDLFDKRYDVVKELWEAFKMIRTNGGVDVEAWRKFRDVRGRAKMLFGSDVEEYLDKVLTQADRAWTLNQSLSNPNFRSPFEQEMTEEYNDLFRLFGGTIPDEMEQLLLRYMRFPEPH